MGHIYGRRPALPMNKPRELSVSPNIILALLAELKMLSSFQGLIDTGTGETESLPRTCALIHSQCPPEKQGEKYGGGGLAPTQK